MQTLRQILELERYAERSREDEDNDRILVVELFAYALILFATIFCCFWWLR